MCFDEVMASDDALNLTADNEGAALADKFGRNGFDYAGNSYKDLAVWNYCDRAIVVQADQKNVSGCAQERSHNQGFPKTRS